MHELADIDDLALLAEFAQLAMARARAASARAETAETEGSDPTAHLVAFDRMGRAMRLALSLRRRFMGEAEAGAVRRVEAGKQRLKAALVPAIRLHAGPLEQVRLQYELDQRLETEADAFAEMPLAVGLVQLRRALGLPALATTDFAGAAACNPLTACGGAPPPGRHATRPPELRSPPPEGVEMGEHLGSRQTVPPPGRSPVEGEVDRATGARRWGLKPTDFAATASSPGPATGPP